MMGWALREAVSRQTCPEGKLILPAEPFLVQVGQDRGRALDVSVSPGCATAPPFTASSALMCAGHLERSSSCNVVGL